MPACASPHISIVVSHPILGLVRIFVTSLGNQIQELIRRIDCIDSSGVGRVSMKNTAILILIEDADSFAIRHAHIASLIVVQDPSMSDVFGSEGCLKVIVVIGWPRGDPLEPPTHP